MKTIFITLLLAVTFSTNTFAGSQDAPRGLEKLTRTLNKLKNPVNAEDKVFNLYAPSDLKGAKLIMKPRSAYEVREVGRGHFEVLIINSSELYDQDLYADGFLLWNTILFEWIKEGDFEPTPNSDSFQECIQVIHFVRENGDEFNASTLSKLKDKGHRVDINFNQSVLSLDVENNFFRVTRLNNQRASVELTITSPSGKTWYKHSTSNINFCKSTGTRPQPRPVPTPREPQFQEMTREQIRHMRFKGVNINVNRVAKAGGAFSKNIKISYDAILTNPYNFDIKCDIVLHSDRGLDENWEQIDSKTHASVFAKAHSSSVVTGVISGKKGKGSNGLNWIENKGHGVLATNCFSVK